MLCPGRIVHTLRQHYNVQISHSLTFLKSSQPIFQNSLFRDIRMKTRITDNMAEDTTYVIHKRCSNFSALLQRREDVLHYFYFKGNQNF